VARRALSQPSLPDSIYPSSISLSAACSKVRTLARSGGVTAASRSMAMR
jgi:hypothetical protein